MRLLFMAFYIMIIASVIVCWFVVPAIIPPGINSYALSTLTGIMGGAALAYVKAGIAEEFKK